MAKKICQSCGKSNQESREICQFCGNNLKFFGIETGGIVYGNVSNAATMYGQDKFSTPRGHGFGQNVQIICMISLVVVMLILWAMIMLNLVRTDW